jgi:hypothetical protein
MLMFLMRDGEAGCARISLQNRLVFNRELSRIFSSLGT